jgi:hypothetical protein
MVQLLLGYDLPGVPDRVHRQNQPSELAERLAENVAFVALSESGWSLSIFRIRSLTMASTTALWRNTLQAHHKTPDVPQISRGAAT